MDQHQVLQFSPQVLQGRCDPDLRNNVRARRVGHEIAYKPSFAAQQQQQANQKTTTLFSRHSFVEPEKPK